MCGCRGGLLKGSPKLKPAKFTPAVVMSVGSLEYSGSEAPASLVHVNLCIQVHDVKSSQAERPNSGSKGKLVFPGQDLSSSSTIPIRPSLLLTVSAPPKVSSSVRVVVPAAGQTLPLLTFGHSPTLLASCLSVTAICFQLSQSPLL